jgi:hypothetical protein
MSNELLPNPPEPTTGGEAITAMNPQGPTVSVFMPFNLEMEELSAELFGQTVDLSGIVIKVNREIPVDALYNPGKMEGWITYLQKEDEDNFEGYVNADMATDVITEIKTSLYLPEGESYDPGNKGVENLDASGVFPNVSPVAWQNYHNIQDVVLAIFAHTILGHPGALSIISNDSSIRASVSTAYEETLEKIKGANDRAITDGFRDLSDFANISGNGVAGGLDQTDLAMILQQFMNQAPDRFATGDRGTPQPLEWKEGDKFYIQMRMFNNKYQIKGGVPASHPVLLNGDYNNVIAPFGAPGIPISDSYYVLEFTVGAAGGGGGGGGGGGPPPPSGPAFDLVLLDPITPSANNAVLSSSSLIIGNYNVPMFESANSYGGQSIKLTYSLPAFEAQRSGRLYIGMIDYNTNNYAEGSIDFFSGTNRFIVNGNGDVTYSFNTSISNTFSIEFNTTTGYALFRNETTNAIIGNLLVGVGSSYKIRIRGENFSQGPYLNQSATITNIGVTYA